MCWTTEGFLKRSEKATDFFFFFHIFGKARNNLVQILLFQYSNSSTLDTANLNCIYYIVFYLFSVFMYIIVQSLTISRKKYPKRRIDRMSRNIFPVRPSSPIPYTEYTYNSSFLYKLHCISSLMKLNREDYILGKRSLASQSRVCYNQLSMLVKLESVGGQNTTLWYCNNMTQRRTSPGNPGPKLYLTLYTWCILAET